MARNDIKLSFNQLWVYGSHPSLSKENQIEFYFFLECKKRRYRRKKDKRMEEQDLVGSSLHLKPFIANRKHEKQENFSSTKK